VTRLLRVVAGVTAKDFFYKTLRFTMPEISIECNNEHLQMFVKLLETDEYNICRDVLPHMLARTLLVDDNKLESLEWLLEQVRTEEPEATLEYVIKKYAMDLLTILLFELGKTSAEKQQMVRPFIPL
jgi:hypothetical protein